ncbi:MAG: FG-GAP-like repeat-containing protein [Marinirhabdus sp.]|nr:FG-GAP-like repeat-containing protein [Marinirhabdus sp.]
MKNLFHILLSFFIISLFSMLDGMAQVTFQQENVLYSADQHSPSDVRDLHSVDINNDGALDLLTGQGKKLTWHENNGSGDFNDTVSHVVDLYSSFDDRIDGVFADDLDNDGDIDIAVVREFRDDVLWYENLGNENFSAPHIVSSSLNGPIAIVIMDVDGDNLKDLIVGTSQDANVVWFKNEGSGAFQTHQVIIQNMGDTAELAYADFDGDAIDDLLIAQTSNSLQWIKNNGDGTFGLEQSIIGQINSGKTIAVGDVDLDGDIDIISETDLSSGSFSYLENDGLGNFGSQHLIDDPFEEVSELKLEDFDTDGLLDVMVVLDSSIIAVYKNLGDTNMDGIVEFDERIDIAEDGFIGSDITLGDFDMDANVDLFYFSTQSIKKTQNNGGLSFITTTISFVNLAFFDIATLDVDADGHQDLLLSSYERISWTRNDGAGNYGNLINIYDTTNGNVIKPQITVGDFNGDGIEDFVTNIGDSVTIFINQGSNQFTRNELFFSQFIKDVDVLDLDQDGDEDIVFNAQDSNIYMLLNTGGGNFLNPVLIEDVFGVTRIKVFDFDNDGDDDIVTNRLGVMENNGMGAFSSHQTISAAVSVDRDFFVVDLDNDGLTDILFGDTVDNYIGYFKNNGNGSYSGEFIHNISNINSLEHADFDNDGDEDILVGRSINNGVSQSSVSYILNNGDGTFESVQGLTVITEPAGEQSMTIKDLNNDGRMDFVTGKKDLSLFINASTTTPFTFIPDDNFEQALIDLGYDDILDNLVLKSTIEAITNIDLSGKGISNAEGIQDFSSLEVLDFSNNNLEGIQLELNDQLKTINLSQNQLSVLNLNNLVNLENVDVSDNALTILNVANGNNIILSQFSSLSNSELECIQVDDANAANNGTGNYTNWLVDGIVMFSENCSICSSTSVTALAQDITVELDSTGIQTITAESIDNGSTDSCGMPALLSIDMETFNCEDVGPNTVVLTATDSNGNIDTTTATVTVVDTMSPTVSGQNATLDLQGQSTVTLNITDVDSGSTDNCELSLMLSIDTFSEVGEYDVVLSGEDSSGNTDSDTVVVTVLDSSLGIKENKTSTFSIVPNPSNDYIQIIGLEKINQVTIYSVSGAIILKHDATNRIDVTPLDSGVYFVEISTSNSRSTKLLLKE